MIRFWQKVALKVDSSEEVWGQVLQSNIPSSFFFTAQITAANKQFHTPKNCYLIFGG